MIDYLDSELLSPRAEDLSAEDAEAYFSIVDNLISFASVSCDDSDAIKEMLSDKVPKYLEILGNTIEEGNS